MNIHAVMQSMMSQGGQEEFNQGRYLDSDPYMLLLSANGETIITLFEFTDLLVANVEVVHLKMPEDEIPKNKRKEILLAKQIVKEHFSELLL